MGHAVTRNVEGLSSSTAPREQERMPSVAASQMMSADAEQAADEWTEVMRAPSVDILFGSDLTLAP